MVVLHSSRANNSSPHTYEASPAAGDQNHLHRERLLDRLEKNRQRLLTLVSTPAGHGKNNLLSCWLDLLHCDYIETKVSHDPP